MWFNRGFAALDQAVSSALYLKFKYSEEKEKQKIKNKHTFINYSTIPWI